MTRCLLVTLLALLPHSSLADDSLGVPLIDLNDSAERQVVVDREPGQYLGHPTTVLLEDGKTMLCVYPEGHGKGAVRYQRSDDGGLTWSGPLPTPESWATSKEVPTLHRVVDADGKKRLIMWSGLYPARLAVSENDGETWSELQPAGEWGGIVMMGSVVPLETGDGHYLAMFHDDGRFFTSKNRQQKPIKFTLFKTLSTDGGLTWSFPEAIQSSTDVHLCEPGVIRSPDGKQLAVLLRENSRTRNSHIIFSDDEGATWTEPRELPDALNGDRHTGKYGPDGRLFISFRSVAPKGKQTPYQGDWVGWVGTYDDLVKGKPGQYQVRLKDNTGGSDCAYPGVEVLPDGTFVTTTYGHWDEGKEPYILSVRFTLDELDRLAQADASPDVKAINVKQRKFKKTQISDEYFAEGAGIGDFNQDGAQDVVCGPYWYAGPDFKERHQIYAGHAFPNDQGYSDNFFSFGHDVNGDGWTDVVTIGFPGRPSHWFENPQGKQGDWPNHVGLASVATESPWFTDLTGDGQPEIVCAAAGRLGYGTYDPKDPTAEWTFHNISDPGPWVPFTHGLGVGDVNGDGRLDVLTALGWMEQPESLEGDPVWEPHEAKFGSGGAQMYARDVDGDGDNDVVTSLAAHRWGLSWFENQSGDDGQITFTEHKIMGEKPSENPYGVAFSQLHAVDLHDMDGDGLKDIVTGKCYWAHNGHDPGARDPAVLYYFKLTRGDEGAEFVPVQIDDDSGVGRQISIGDLDGDGRPDIAVANKKGVFVFE